MWNQSYLQLLEKLLGFHLKFLSPWRLSSKRSKLFLACFASPLILVLIITTFVYFDWDALLFTIVAENVVYAIAAARSIGYSILVNFFFSDYKKQIDQLLVDRCIATLRVRVDEFYYSLIRKSLPSESRELTMTEGYCRTELRLLIAYHLNCLCLIFVLLHALVYFFPNAYQLPLNCYIIFLPFDAFSFAWELNYLIIAVTAALLTLFLVFYIPIPLVLINQSCWLIDMAFITAEHINEGLQKDEDIHNPVEIAKTDIKLKKLAIRCKKFVEWQSEVQDLLFCYFSLEFQVQSLIMCFSIYVLSRTFSSAIMIFSMFCLIQISVLCWMATRVTSRIDKLSIEIYKNWNLLIPSQRKSLQMLLHWTQNVKGYSGMFNDVNLETCKKICEASYSLYTFLRSTNPN